MVCYALFSNVDCGTLNRLIGSWELANVEFKSRLAVQGMDDTRRKDFASALASLANRGGGYLVIGVNDTTHSIEEGGFEDEDGLALQVAHLNRDHCSPPTEIRHEYLACPDGRVMIIDVAKRGSIPHAVVRRRGGEIAERLFYIRNNQGKQLVTDTELQQMFLNVDFPILRRSFPFVKFYRRDGLDEPYFEDLPPWGRNDVAFHTMLSNVGPLGGNEPEKISRVIAEIFPYAVLSAIDRGLSGGWGRKLTPAGGGVLIKTGGEPAKSFDSDNIPTPPENSIVGSSPPAFKETAKLLVFLGLSLPPNTDITIEYPDASSATSTLVLKAEGVYRIAVRYRGGSWSIGLPQDHPHAYRVHPTFLRGDDPHGHVRGHVDMEFDMEFGRFGPRAVGDYYSWARRLFDIIEWELSWAKYLERLPDPQHLRMDRNVREILKRMQGE